MIGALRTWLLSIIAAGLVLAILYALLPKGRLRPIVRTAGGVVLMLVILRPLTELDLGGFAVSYDDYAREIRELPEQYRAADTAELAAIIEQHHDDNGIVWPIAVAPYHVIITVMKPDDEVQAKVADQIYSELTAAGVEVMLDDRKERPGVKFKDADLLGIPVRITVGRGAADGMIEYKMRRDADKEEMSAAEGIKKAIDVINAEK